MQFNISENFSDMYVYLSTNQKIAGNLLNIVHELNEMVNYKF